MRFRRRWLVTGVTAAALAVAAGTAVAQSQNTATGPATEAGERAQDAAEGPDAPISDAAVLQQASAAALAHTGGGRVTGTEVGDEESLYEIEVTLDDGRQVDVQLDAQFRVVGAADDSE